MEEQTAAPGRTPPQEFLSMADFAKEISRVAGMSFA
jgi:hypothetical protein